ncbi:hypothetical protein LY90DRAFT_508337 [Neocallimastix californiae]|uniref:Homeobox domain-containing protein n=1 Tax=Neocallimastix californiae TaxID=1754190 RepID=A0A1Y2CXH1_9FUNG|nr:hypothetical protein LY90DRAFT_508337 [Neocallimastix californiae]|eukprot:ORY51739.1 hypothetical protein LY90DRAFT_508337 [Neocallimastix californiae]
MLTSTTTSSPVTSSMPAVSASPPSTSSSINITNNTYTENQNQTLYPLPSSSSIDSDGIKDVNSKNCSTSKNNENGSKNDYANIDPRKRKRRRTSHDEQILLDSFFRKNHFPNAALRQILSADTGMSARAVQIWFQNRRQAERKKKTKNHNNMNMNLGLRMNLGMNMGFGFGMGLGLPLMNLPMQRPNANILPSTNVIGNNSNNINIKSMKNETNSEENQMNLDMKNSSVSSLQMPAKAEAEKGNLPIYPRSVGNKSSSFKSNYSNKIEKKGPQPILPKHLISNNTNTVINKNKSKIKNKVNDSSKNIDIQSSLNHYSALTSSFNNNESSMKDNTFSIFKKESNNTIPQKNIPILPNTLQYSNMFNNNNNTMNNNTKNSNVNNNNVQQININCNNNDNFNNQNMMNNSQNIDNSGNNYNYNGEKSSNDNDITLNSTNYDEMQSNMVYSASVNNNSNCINSNNNNNNNSTYLPVKQINNNNNSNNNYTISNSDTLVNSSSSSQQSMCSHSVSQSPSIQYEYRVQIE